MRRSDINAILKDAQAFFDKFSVKLPPFAHLAPHELAALSDSDVIQNNLGWDVTDYGLGKFDTQGLFLFTARNGKAENLKKGEGITYAEKIMISRKDQYSPMHRHYSKTEDIINRGGGRLVLELFGPDAEGFVDKEASFTVPMDGVERTFTAGSRVALEPGESITLVPGIWHAFWGEGDDVLIGEVSTVNDDNIDNWFAEPLARFSEVEEDEAPWHLLVSDYPNLAKWKAPAAAK